MAHDRSSHQAFGFQVVVSHQAHENPD